MCAYFGRVAGCSTPSAFPLLSNRDRRLPPGVHLLRPSRGLAPRQAVCIFGQIETDASLQACTYSGPIVAPHRVKRFVSSVKSRPTHRSRRALTSAQSWPRTASSGLFFRSNRDRRIAPSVHLLRPNCGPAPRQAVCIFGQIETGASLQACTYFGPILAPHRVKRFASSVMTLSDRLGARAPKVIRA
jgi:uncharacterized protein YjeT (DUF2065 family)